MKAMSDKELRALMKRTDETAYPEIGGARIAVELARRELARSRRRKRRRTTSAKP